MKRYIHFLFLTIFIMACGKNTNIDDLSAGQNKEFKSVGYWQNWSHDTNWGKCPSGEFAGDLSQFDPYTHIVYAFVTLSKHKRGKHLCAAKEDVCVPLKNNGNIPSYIEYDGMYVNMVKLNLSGSSNKGPNCSAVTFESCKANLSDQPEWQIKQQCASECSRVGGGCSWSWTDNKCEIPSWAPNSDKNSALSCLSRSIAAIKQSGKKLLLGIGGWSDWVSFSASDTDEMISDIVNLVELSGADGVDFDFEHITYYQDSKIDKLNNEYKNYKKVIKQVSQQLREKGKLVSYTTRFNAFMYKNNQVSDSKYYSANIGICNSNNSKSEKHKCSNWPSFQQFPSSNLQKVIPTQSFNTSVKNKLFSSVPSVYKTDHEGEKLQTNDFHFNEIADFVNIMAYDAGHILIDRMSVLEAFEKIGQLDKDKLVMGFEPGNQADDSYWEGFAYDKDVIRQMQQENYGGAMIWAINSKKSVSPKNAICAPILANYIKNSSDTYQSNQCSADAVIDVRHSRMN